MPPSKLNCSNIYSVWQRKNRLGAKIPQDRVKFKVGYLVGITKKAKFAKGYEQPFSTDISGCQVYAARALISLRTDRLDRSSYRRPYLQFRACQSQYFSTDRVFNI
jgi:hypothetical protein